MAKDENEKWLFGRSGGDQGEWEAHRRFISPSFNAIYRQGVVGPRHLKEAEFALFLQAARDGSQVAAQKFETWFHTDRDEGGDYGDVAMERIGARAHSLDVETALGIIRVFSDVMDEYSRVRPRREMLVDSWQQSKAIIRTFNSLIPNFRLGQILREIVSSGRALSWMFSAIAREELWSHGVAGDRPKEYSSRLLTSEELDFSTRALTRRINNLSTADILSLPRLPVVMYCISETPWLEDEFIRLVRRLSGPRASDKTFLTFLESMASVIISSDRGAYNAIRSSNISELIGPEEFDRRWSAILRKSLPGPLSAQRDRIISMMNESKNW
jgi:hypothetical protein